MNRQEKKKKTTTTLNILFDRGALIFMGYILAQMASRTNCFVLNMIKSHLIEQYEWKLFRKSNIAYHTKKRVHLNTGNWLKCDFLRFCEAQLKHSVCSCVYCVWLQISDGMQPIQLETFEPSKTCRSQTINCFLVCILFSLFRKHFHFPEFHISIGHWPHGPSYSEACSISYVPLESLCVMIHDTHFVNK